MVAILTVAVIPTASHAEWLENGTPVCSEIGSQYNFSAVSDGSGGLYAAWMDTRGSARVFANRLTADGNVAPGWAVNGIRVSDPVEFQIPPKATSDEHGNLYVAWRALQDGQSPAIRVARFGADGEGAAGWPVDGVLVSLPTPSGVPNPLVMDLASDGQGGVYVLWKDIGSEVARLQRIASNGTPAPGWPDTSLIVERRACWGHCEPDGRGGVALLVTTWEDYYESYGTGAWVRNASPSGTLSSAGLATSANGYCEIFGERLVSSPHGGAFFAHANGSVVAGRVRPWNEPGPALAWKTLPVNRGVASEVAVAVDDVGGLLVAFNDFVAGDHDLGVQRLTAAGQVPAGWPLHGVAVDAGPLQKRFPSVSAVGPSSLAVAWAEERGSLMHDIYALGLSTNGDILGMDPPSGRPVCVQPGQQVDLVLIPSIQGSAIAMWRDGRAFATDGPDLYALRLEFEQPVAVTASIVSAEVAGGAAHLVWSIVDGVGLDATVHRTSDGSAWAPLARVAVDGSGVVRYEDADVRPGVHYGYRLGIIEQGVERYFGEAWLTIPRLDFALEGMTPNPSGGRARIAFTLPDDAPTTLEVLDVTGRHVARHDVGARGAGRHVLDATTAELAPGVYVVRLTRGDATLTARAAVVR